MSDRKRTIQTFPGFMVLDTVSGTFVPLEGGASHHPIIVQDEATALQHIAEIYARNTGTLPANQTGFVGDRYAIIEARFVKVRYDE